MSGETGAVIQMEPKRQRRVSNGTRGGNHGARITALEGRMTNVEKLAAETRDNTAELLAIATAAKGVAGMAKKHGPRIVAFGTGLLAAAGIGNPQVWAFINTFFG